MGQFSKPNRLQVEAKLRQLSLPLLAAAASSSLCSPTSSDVPVQGFRPPDFPVRVRCFPGCASPSSMHLSASLSPPSPPASRLSFFVSSPSTVPCSCACSPCLFLPPPLHPPYAAPDAPIQGRFYPGRSSPGPPPSGCSSSSAFPPLMFQSGFHVLIRFSCFFFSSLVPTLVPQGRFHPGFPVQGLHHPDVPVWVRCFLGGFIRGSTRLSASPSSPSPPFSPLLFFGSVLFQFLSLVHVLPAASCRSRFLLHL